jgi:hypothetical protein
MTKARVLRSPVIGKPSRAGTVTLTGTAILTTTLDAQWRYSFAEVKPGDYSIEMMLNVDPCTMGGPSGVMVSEDRSWTANYLSFRDDYCIIMLKFESFHIADGKVVNKTLDLTCRWG